MTAHIKSFSTSISQNKSFGYPGVKAGTALFYSNGTSPESWTQESAKIKITITDTVVGRARLMEALISNPRGIKDANYPQYRRVRVVDGFTGIKIFQGRIEISNPYYDNNLGQMLKIIARDYSAELFERKVDKDYRILFGTSTIGANTNSKDWTIMSKFTATFTGTIDGIGLYSLAAGNVKVGIYADSTGSPGARLAVNNTGGACKASTWNEIALSATLNVTKNTSYWIACNSDTDSVIISYDGTGNRAVKSLAYTSGLPDPAGSSYTTAINEVQCFYAYGKISSRSALIAQIVTDYTSTVSPHIVNATTYIEASGSTQKVAKNYTNSGRTPIDIIEELAKEDPWDDALSGYGYDYYIDDNQKFHYFKRGSLPSGGANTNGLIISLDDAQSGYIRKMQRDYNISEQPKEVVTRVTCRGTSKDGTNVSYTATDSALEASLGITKEKIEYVWGKELISADLTTYCTNRANALLHYNSGQIYRGTVKIAKYPAFNRGSGNVIVRAGDVVRLKIACKSINSDYVVLGINYIEPNGFAEIEVISSTLGRSYSPLDAVSQLKSMRAGDDVTIQTARINDLIVDNAKIGSCSIDKLTAGELTVAGTITSSGKFVTGISPNPRIEITNTLIVGYSDATTKQFYLQASDGKAYAGAGAVILDSTGLIIDCATGNTFCHFKDGTDDGYIYQDGIDLVAGSNESGGALIALGKLRVQSDGLTTLSSSVHPNIGTASEYFNEVFAKTFTDVGCPIPYGEQKSLWDTFKNMKTKKRKITVKEAEIEGLGSRAIERIAANDGGEFEEIDHNTYPNYLLSIPSKEEYDKIEKEYKEKLKLSKEAIKVPPKTGICINELVYAQTKIIQELIEKIEILEKKK